jgi:hypothetical protein
MGPPHHPLPISHFSTKEKHTKNKKKELKFTCRELKFPMERNIEFPNTMDLAQKLSPSPHSGDELKFTMKASSFPTQGV